MSRKKSQSGFSIIEMVLAAAITVGLTGVMFYFIRTAQSSFVTEGSVSDMNQNFRAAIDLISRDIQAAGAGVPLFLGPIAGKGAVNANGQNYSDRILILFGDPNAIPVTVKSASALTPLPNLTLPTIYTDSPTTPFTTGKPYILYSVAQRQDHSADVSESSDFAIFTLADTNKIVSITGGIKLIPTISALNDTTPTLWDSTISFPTSDALQVTALDETVEYMVDRSARTLNRNRNKSGWVVVARGIDDLDFQYQMETFNTSTNTYDAPFWVDEPGHSAANNRALIRAVRFTLKGRTQLQADMDRQGQRLIAQTVEVTPRNLALPGFIPNR